MAQICPKGFLYWTYLLCSLLTLQLLSFAVKPNQYFPSYIFQICNVYPDGSHCLGSHWLHILMMKISLQAIYMSIGSIIETTNCIDTTEITRFQCSDRTVVTILRTALQKVKTLSLFFVYFSFVLFFSQKMPENITSTILKHFIHRRK